SGLVIWNIAITMLIVRPSICIFYTSFLHLKLSCRDGRPAEGLTHYLDGHIKGTDTDQRPFLRFVFI
ncbi:MAG: hypothetical protein ACLVL7_11725, partial [Anaerotruncus massiliensis (ex Togo et al. 2019)]